MKKILLITSLSLLSFSNYAQESESASTSGDLKGKKFLGAALGFTSADNTTTTRFAPYGGYFIKSDIALGIGVGYKGTSYSSSSVSMITIKPLARKYFNIQGSLYFYGEANLPINIGKNESGASSFSTGIGISPGIDYFFNKWLSVDASFDVFAFGFSSVASSTTVNFGVDTSAPAQLGVKYTF